MPRVYKRKFDWDEARRRRAAGETYPDIARSLGVSIAAVRFAVNDDERERAAQRVKEWQRSGTCIDCGQPCSRTFRRKEHRCNACAGKARITNVRDGELRCATCETWKPDDDFPRSSHVRCIVRRGRHRVCRMCSTKLRREYRERHKVPCSGGCGRMVLPGNEKGVRGLPIPQCHSCARKAAAARMRETDSTHESRNQRRRERYASLRVRSL